MPAKALALDQLLFLRRLGRMDGFVELVGFFLSLCDDLVYVAKWIGLD